MRNVFWGGLVIGAIAFGVACSSSSSDNLETDDQPCAGQCHVDSGGDATQNHDDGGDSSVDCDYPDDAGNDPRCPATYSTGYAYQVCPQVGLSCGYPGRGDGESNGCFATAVLICNDPDAGLGGGVDAAIFDDAGDSGVGYWTFAQ